MNDLVSRLRIASSDEHVMLVLTKEAADEIERLRAAASLALYEMRNTVAPRNSFTDAVDALDAVLHPKS